MNAKTDLGPRLTAADPLCGVDAELPALTAEIAAAQAAADRGLPGPAHHVRRRPVLLVSAAVGLAAAATVAVLVVPSSTPGAADHAAAQELTHLLTNVRAAAPLAYSTLVYRLHEITQVATTTGYATYRQTTVRTETVSAAGTRYRYAFGRPRWLTPDDARRARHITDPSLPQRGTSNLRDPACRTGHGRYCLTQAYLASLPTSAPALATRLQADVDTRGGCASGPGCPAENLIPILFAPGAPGPLRAATLQLLARSPGVKLWATGPSTAAGALPSATTTARTGCPRCSWSMSTTAPSWPGTSTRPGRPG